MATESKRVADEDDLAPGDLADLVRTVRFGLGSGRLTLRDLMRLFAGEPISDGAANRDLIDEDDDGNYIRMTRVTAKTVTFLAGDSPGYNARFQVRLRCVGAGDLTLVGETVDVVLNPPAGGTLVLEDGMTVTVKRVGLNQFDVFGQTVPV